MEEAPVLFRCPISMELMENPVTVSTGVTYEKKNIEKWLFTYKKSTCPATMQRLQTFDLTPNLTLKSLIVSWLDRTYPAPLPPSPSSSSNTMERHNLVSILKEIESAPFKVSLLKKLQAMIEAGEEMQKNFVESWGIEMLGQIMIQVGEESGDFIAFRACEEAVGVLRHLSLNDETSVNFLSNSECVKSMVIMLQRGSAEARLNTMVILQKISRNNSSWNDLVSNQDIDVYKSLLDLLSDEISTRLSSFSLDVLVEIFSASKKSRPKAIEAGAVCVLVELLPDAGRYKCEKILLLLKQLCQCPEGRSALAEHGLGIATVSKKISRVSELATKLGVKILWLMCSSWPSEKVLDEMMAFGAVRKLLGLLHVGGRSSTREKAIKIIRLHGKLWKHYPCFPCEFKEFVM